MKKLVCVLMVLFLGFITMAVAQQVIVVPDQRTVYWDNDPSNAALSGIITTEVYIVPLGSDKAVESDWVFQGETDQEFFVLTFATEGQFVVGIRAKRVLPAPNDSTIIYSDMNWSDVNGEGTPIPFIVFYATAPNINKNLRLIE